MNSRLKNDEPATENLLGDSYERLLAMAFNADRMRRMGMPKRLLQGEQSSIRQAKMEFEERNRK